MTELIINGKPYLVDIETDTPLLWAIRDTVGLTGTQKRLRYPAMRCLHGANR
ncbi:MAG: hypothetical protein CM1200mP28_11170 [Deltaproteobacteria bacterium]|nr:MAG: hypothetical protein CM1200mP28_11170 [Deltaproteobacteria bacterium]